MKKSVFLFILLIVTSLICRAQENIALKTDSTHTYIVEKNDGTLFIGQILSKDAREIFIKSERLGKVYIPLHTIKEIRLIENKGKETSSYVGEELFATRYFITTNGLPIKKSENYIQWNLYGPDFQFGVADNFGVGVMTSWMAIPIIATTKYSIKISENKHIALGALAGTGSWALPDFGLVLPFVAFTTGNRTNNLTLSAGYGGLFYSMEEYNPQTNNYSDKNYTEGRFLFSIAGMAKISPKLSLVFDTFISPYGPEVSRYEWRYYNNQEHYVEVKEKSPNLAIILPGLRWQLDPDRAFQFGFTGFYYDSEFIPAPIPMVQFFRRL